ncbi:MAG: hypothetical protein WCH99_08940 [Verrucomicrobiota bacterium]
MKQCTERQKSGKCLFIRTANKLQNCQQLGLAVFDGSTITTTKVIDDLIAAKTAANRRDEYLKSLKYYLETFVNGFGGQPIDQITPTEIEKRLTEIAGEQSDNSRQTWFTRVNTLFAYAKRRGLIAENPVDRLERITVDRKDPVILTVEQSRLLLKTCPTVLRPYLILGMFAGVRPGGELMKLSWEHINLEAGTVAINFPKVRKHRRVVNLEPIALSLLKKHPLKTGLVAPSKSTVRRWKRKARHVLGFDKWPQDILRHTAASFLIALHNDTAKIARELGNSPNILLTHYVVPVTKEDCKKFWTL